MTSYHNILIATMTQLSKKDINQMSREEYLELYTLATSTLNKIFRPITIPPVYIEISTIIALYEATSIVFSIYFFPKGYEYEGPYDDFNKSININKPKLMTYQEIKLSGYLPNLKFVCRSKFLENLKDSRILDFYKMDTTTEATVIILPE